MSLSVFNPSLCYLWAFMPVLCHYLMAMLLVGILPQQALMRPCQGKF